MTRAAIAAIVGALVTRSVAHADSSYRRQVMLSDGLSDAAIATVAIAPLRHATHGWLPIVGMVGVVVGGPIVHAAHGDTDAAWGSLGLRLGLPLAGGFLATRSCDNHPIGPTPDESGGSGPDCIERFVEGAAVGILAAQILDWTLLHSTDATDAPVMLRLGGAF